MLKLNPVHFIKPMLIICSHSNYVLLLFTHPNIKYFYSKYFINDNNTGVRVSELSTNLFAVIYNQHATLIAMNWN